jgi:hypothetical protein
VHLIATVWRCSLFRRLFRRRLMTQRMPETNLRVPADLDGSRRDLFDWFAKNAPSLGELFDAAVRMLDDSAFPGRGYLICHALREIGNRLPHVVATLPNEGTLQYPERVGDLMELWDAAGFREDSSGALAGRPLVPELTPVLSPVLNEMGRLIGDHRNVYRKRREKAVALFEALAGEISEPVIAQWMEVTRWFARKAHHPRAFRP